MRFAIVPLVFALSAVAGAQQPAPPKTTTPPPSVPPPITFPFPPLMTPPAGGLNSPVPFTPTDPTQPARDLYRLPIGQPFNSGPLKPSRGFGGGAYFGPIYPAYETDTTAVPRRLSPPQVSGLLRLDVTPESAQVFVDSFFAGLVSDIDDRRGLTLTAGPHRIELRAVEYTPTSFDVRIDPNETVFYRAALERPRPSSPVEARPAGPTRLYVIPGCYAGNMPPRADRLPSGCNIKQVRVLETPR
jgi:hypothetical protein